MPAESTGAATTSAAGSPKKPLNTLTAVARIADAMNTAAGTTSGRRRRTSVSIATASGAPTASAIAIAALASSIGTPDR